MAIKGITDVNKTISTVGRIRTGIKVKEQNNREYPKEVPYFFLNPYSETRGPNGKPIKDPETGKNKITVNDDIVLAIEKLGTDSPETLQVIFPMDPLENEDLFISSYMKWWGNGKLKCMGDGEFAHFKGTERVPGHNTPEVIQREIGPLGWITNRVCNTEMCPQALSGACKPETNIRIMVPEISDMKIFQLDTRSLQVVQSIYTDLRVLKEQLLRKNIRSIAGIPLIMYREERSNLKQGRNYIVKLKFAERKYEEQLVLQKETGNSLLSYGDVDHINVDPMLIDEPNFDLLPQSSHGVAQTGEIKAPAPKVLPGQTTPEQWIEDVDVKERFDGLANLLKTRVTKPKMLARARKYKTKEDLLVYLDAQLSNGQVVN